MALVCPRILRFIRFLPSAMSAPGFLYFRTDLQIVDFSERRRFPDSFAHGGYGAAAGGSAVSL